MMILVMMMVLVMMMIFVMMINKPYVPVFRRGKLESPFEDRDRPSGLIASCSSSSIPRFLKSVIYTKMDQDVLVTTFTTPAFLGGRGGCRTTTQGFK